MRCRGVPTRTREAVQLFAVKKAPDLHTRNACAPIFQTQLTGYKCRIHRIPESAENNVGKILRRALRDGA